ADHNMLLIQHARRNGDVRRRARRGELRSWLCAAAAGRADFVMAAAKSALSCLVASKRSLDGAQRNPGPFAGSIGGTAPGFRYAPSRLLATWCVRPIALLYERQRENSCAPYPPPTPSSTLPPCSTRRSASR